MKPEYHKSDMILKDNEKMDNEKSYVMTCEYKQFICKIAAPLLPGHLHVMYKKATFWNRSSDLSFIKRDSWH